MAPLHLEVLAGSGVLDRQVRWVAVSELEDPTPFLEGGELLLTTGMRLGPDTALPYVSRLVARGVAGLGFGVGLSHEDVPPELVTAAAEAGLPLIEVPRDTPFIAIGKAVSELLAAEQYEEISRAFAAQGRLTRAALQAEGMNSVIERLAREIDGWALLLDAAGAVRHAARAGRPDARARALEPELARLRTPGAPSSIAVSTPGDHVIVQPLGRRGFFAVGSARPFTPIGHTIVNAAGSLLTLGLEQGREQRTAERRVRAAVLRLLLAGERAAAGETLAAIGGELPAEPFVVLACDTDESHAQGFPHRDLTVMLTHAEEAEEAIALASRRGKVGASGPVGYAELAQGIDQAERALASAAPVARFPELAGQGLLSLLDPATAAAFSSALLAPLREYGSRADLIESLRAYLACNGHWDAAAQRLGVHRHTLRYRMRRVSELLGRDLDDPAARAELWIALSCGPR
ncbi:PucR family transcriptional regulator [Microtetraspora sp. NBRC 16547]|uniref:PucR family transcriptional regulator n=1 Tax=Microtetraspora sp. NBRC 16547 TaxID=3030993 RepID=UPI002554E40C|nr:PucR family transcriptional regulator [Microtetraspora sp. NBRC 16547]